MCFDVYDKYIIHCFVSLNNNPDHMTFLIKFINLIILLFINSLQDNPISPNGLVLMTIISGSKTVVPNRTSFT